MLRVIVAIMAVVALAVPAAAYETTWDGDAAGDITIYLTLDCYIQIEWQDTDIVFDGVSGWFCDQLEDVAYAACPDGDGKFPTDPWAGSSYYASGGLFYESADGAVIFIRSNNPLSMSVTTNGDLYFEEEGCESYIPTWFTMCAAPFMVDGVWTGVGDIPGDGWGTYLNETGAGVLGYNDPVEGKHPNQTAFPCAPPANNWVLGPLCPGIEGTLKFLGRIHRHGMEDMGGNYTTVLNVLFTSP